MKEKCCLKADIRALHVKRIDRKLRYKGIKKQLLNPLTDRVFREVVSEVEQAHIEFFAVEKRVMRSLSRDKRIRTGGIGVITKLLPAPPTKATRRIFLSGVWKNDARTDVLPKVAFKTAAKASGVSGSGSEPMRPHCPFSPPKGVTSESPSSSAAASLTPPKAESSLV